MRLEGLSAFVKEAKITSKGILLNLENVKLNGSTIDELASLVQTEIYIDVESAQQELSLDSEVAEEEELDFNPEETAEETLEKNGFEVVGS